MTCAMKIRAIYHPRERVWSSQTFGFEINVGTPESVAAVRYELCESISLDPKHLQKINNWIVGCLQKSDPPEWWT